MDKIKEKLKDKNYKMALYVIGILIIILIIFQIGMFVGVRKASYSYGWGDNYKNTFDGPRGEFGGGGMMRGFSTGGDLANAHGAVGKIIKINLPTIVVIGPDNVEKIVLIKDDTLVMEFRNKINATELKVNDEVVIIGSPNNDFQIEAKLIRIVPNQMMGGINSLPSTSTTTKQ